MTASVREFYGRWASLYDPLSRRFPRIRVVRRAVADACRLDPGDTVVEMGCGTGANLPYLRRAVGPTGTVVGVDVTGPALRRARDRFRGVENVHVVQGDAARPPVGGPVDAVVGTFVSGMFEDPGRVVDGWCDLAPGGHVVLADAAPSDRPGARPIEAAFRAFVLLSTPPTLRLHYESDPVERLENRVRAAHQAVERRATATASETYLFGFVRLTGGRIG